MTDRELMQQALEALEVATTPLAKDRQEVLRAQAALRERLAQPEHEPFCYHDGRNIVGKEYAHHCDVFPLYTEPQLEQESLTDEQIIGLWQHTKEPDGHRIERFARAIEAAHGIGEKPDAA